MLLKTAGAAQRKFAEAMSYSIHGVIDPTALCGEQIQLRHGTQLPQRDSEQPQPGSRVFVQPLIQQLPESASDPVGS